MVTYAKDIDWEALKKEIEAEEIQDDLCDNKVKQVYFGSVFHATPSGKYYMPWASSNVTEGEAEEDEEWWEEMDKEAGKHGLFITSGEGDPTDIFVGMVVEEAEGGEQCLLPKKSTKRRRTKK